MKSFKIFLAFHMLIAAVTLGLPLSAVAELDKHIVLHISSYGQETQWESDMAEGIKAGLEPFGGCDYYAFSLDSRRVQPDEGYHDSMARLIVETFKSRAPDVVVVSDNEALEFVRERYSALFDGVPVVFCGINGFTSAMIDDISEYATGCSETLSAGATVREMVGLFPDADNIFVINDHTYWGNKFRGEIEEQLKKLNLEVGITYSENITKSELLRQVSALNENTLILLGSYFSDSDGERFTETEIQEALAGAAKTPVFVLVGSSVGHGSFGGLVTCPYNQGYTAGRMAGRVLEGEPVSSVPPIYSSEGLNEWVFDMDVAGRYKISAGSLPDKYVELNAGKNVFGMLMEFPVSLLMGCLLFVVAVLTTLLVVFARKNKEHAIIQAARVQSEASYRYSAKGLLMRLEHFMEFAPISFIIAVDGIVAEANGYSSKELGVKKGEPITKYFKSPETLNVVWRDLKHREYVNGEIANMVTPDGKTLRQIVNFGSTEYDGKDGVLIFAVNIEELERQKDYVRRTQDDLQKIIDALPVAMAIVDISTSELEYVNNSFLSVYGYETAEEASSFDFASVTERVFAGWQGKTVVFEHENDYVREHGIHIKLFADQIAFRGKNCIVLIGQDVTAEIRRAEMLSRAAEKEKEANVLKGTFLANMSHEIRTPMNAIIGLSQIALLKEQTRENKDVFMKISASARNLLSIIDDILDFSKIEAEKLDIVKELFNIEETITNAFLVASERMEDKRVEILLDVRPDVPCFMYGDKTRLWQILKNLLDNAVKYTNEGRIVLKISVESQDKDEVTLLFNVKDTGIGMTAEQLSKVFVPFEQFSRNNSRKAGTGLGMPITKQLVEMLGGTITVESAPNVGSEFFISIPFALPENHPTIMDQTLSFTKTRVDDLGGAALLVDDDEISLYVMSELLRGAGIESVSVSNSESALAAVRDRAEEGRPFGVILIDYLLGEENGLELAKKISTFNSDMKLLLVTAYSRRIISETEVRDAGIRDIIEKPFVVSSFLEKVFQVFPEQGHTTMWRPVFPDARVLVCEDNDINQMVAIGLLENFGITPDIAEDGKQALELLEKNTYDLVFMDIVMPVLDGHETTKIIRASDKPYKDIPIVAMTANVMQEDIEQCVREGMNGHVEKPVSIERFQEALISCLKYQSE